MLLLAALLATALTVHSAPPPPFKKTSRLVVVGAGPAGLHMASRLQALGYRNITLLERTHRVGGKSYTMYRDGQTHEPCTQPRDNVTGLVNTEDCIAHEMGTCFLHNGYHSVRDLVAEYDLAPEVAPKGRAMFSRFSKDQWTPTDLSDFVMAAILDEVDSGAVDLPWWVPETKPFRSETLMVMVGLVNAVDSYSALHRELLGEVEFSLPARPSPGNMKRMDMPFEQFLVRNKLTALVPFLAFAHSAQGYGFINTIPAFYGLSWVTPELLNGYIQQSLHQKIEEVSGMTSNNPLVKAFVKKLVACLVDGETEQAVYRTTTMLPQGFQSIWTTMYERDALDVRFGVDISRIDRQLGSPAAPVRVTYAQDGGAPRTEEFDFLLYTAAFASAHKFVADLTPAEGATFEQLTSFVLATTLYQSDAVAGYSDGTSDRAIMYAVSKMRNRSAAGQWYADRDDPSIFGGGSAPPRATNQTRVGYQFLVDGCAHDPVLCDADRSPDPFLAPAPQVDAQLRGEFAAQRVGGVEVLRQFAWPYFHHFNTSGVAAGLPWDILERQGSAKTWWIGASAFFESVHDVVNYNNQLLAQQLSAGVEGDAARSRRLRVEEGGPSGS